MPGDDLARSLMGHAEDLGDVSDANGLRLWQGATVSCRPTRPASSPAMFAAEVALEAGRAWTRNR
jgi:hypothetical protein